MNKDELAAIYESKVFNGGEKEVVVEAEKAKGTVTTGRDFGNKAKEMASGTGPDPKNVDVKMKPKTEKRFSSGKEKVNEETDMKDMLPKSSFEELFKSTLVSEAGLEGDESPLEKDEFSDEEGEFAPEGEEMPSEDEEVDVATELRMIIDRLTEIAEKLGAYEDEELGGEEGEMGMDEPGMESDEIPVGEAAQATKELKPMPDTKGKMQSKGNMKVQSAFTPAGGTASKGGPGKQGADGKLKPMSKSKFGPTMSMKADAKSSMGKQGSNLF